VKLSSSCSRIGSSWRLAVLSDVPLGETMYIEGRTVLTDQNNVNTRAMAWSRCLEVQMRQDVLN
jgi:hypothetical protein